MLHAVVFLKETSTGAIARPILGMPALARVVRRLDAAGARWITLVGRVDGAVLRSALAGQPRHAAVSVCAQLPEHLQPRCGAEAVLFWDADLFAGAGTPAALAAKVRETAGVAAPVHAESGPCDGAVAVAPPVLKELGSLAACRSTADVQALVPEAVRSDELEAEGVLARIGDRSSLKQIEWSLLNELRKPMETDGFLGALLYRSISLRLTRWLARTPMTPNHATALSLVLGLAGAGAMASGTATGFVVGALLLQLGALSDCVDGELARLKDQGSLWGAWFDTVADDIVNNSFILATGVGLARYHDSLWPLALALAAVVLILPGIAFMYRELMRTGKGDLCDFEWSFEDGADEGQRPLQAVLAYLVKRDVYVFFFLVCALVGLPEVILGAGLLGAAGFAISVTREALARSRKNPTVPADRHAEIA